MTGPTIYLPDLVDVPATRRQIARTLEFNTVTARHINWDSIAAEADKLGAHFESRVTPDLGRVVTMYWDGEPESSHEDA